MYSDFQLKWSYKPPTVPGWYWVRMADEDQIVEVEQRDEGLVYWMVGLKEHAKVTESSHRTQWLGPLPLPDRQA